MNLLSYVQTNLKYYKSFFIIPIYNLVTLLADGSRVSLSLASARLILAVTHSFQDRAEGCLTKLIYYKRPRYATVASFNKKKSLDLKKNYKTIENHITDFRSIHCMWFDTRLTNFINISNSPS